MPEYLTPGVYVEETSFRSRSIEGVATSTFGMAGLTRYGPVPYFLTPPNWPRPLVMVPSPTLVTSFTEFERAFGGLGDVGNDGLSDRQNYLAYAARAFFANGGRRLYVSRVFPFVTDAEHRHRSPSPTTSRPSRSVTRRWRTFRSRWPGAAGNEFAMSVSFQRSKNILIPAPAGERRRSRASSRERRWRRSPTPPRFPRRPSRQVPPVAANVQVVARAADGTLGFRGPNNTVVPIPGGVGAVAHLTLTVNVRWGAQRLDSYPGLELDSAHPRGFGECPAGRGPRRRAVAGVVRHRQHPAGTAGSGRRGHCAAHAGYGEVPHRRRRGQRGYPGRHRGDSGRPGRREAGGHRAWRRSARSRTSPSSPCPDAVRFDQAGADRPATNNLIGHCERRRYRIGDRRPARRTARSPRCGQFRAQFDTQVRRPLLPVDGDPRPDRAARPGRAAAAAAAAAVGLRRRHLRPQRHRARRAQGAGQRGGARHHAVRARTSPSTGRRCSTPRASTRCGSSRAAATGSGAPAR